MTRKPAVTASTASGSRRSSPRFADIPTAMKNSPSSSPLNGSRSASSSWRNSLSASSTPARKAPSDIESPANLANSEVAITTSSAAALNTSATWIRATTRSAGRSRIRPPPMITTARIRNSFSSARPQAPCAAAVSCGTSSGSTASTGSTARSWNSRMPKAARPCWVFSCLRSASTCRTSGVEDSDRPNPMIAAVTGGCPSPQAAAPRAAAHEKTCAAPRPNTLRRITHSRVGCSSRPMMNSSSTMPNSETCARRPTSPMRFSPHGPIARPAAT